MGNQHLILSMCKLLEDWKWTVKTTSSIYKLRLDWNLQYSKVGSEFVTIQIRSDYITDPDPPKPKQLWIWLDPDEEQMFQQLITQI